MMAELAAAQSSAPRILGRYAIYDAIASGGMATVHYGRLIGPVGFARTVAIKRLHPQFAQDPEFVTMFLDEARLAARIRHPNVVATLDVVTGTNEIFLVMDYVHGESLARVLRQVIKGNQTVPLPIALRIATDVLQGLHAAHEATDERGVPLKIVHRDVSPQNVLLGIDGIARLVDFGVAKAMGRAAQVTREGHLKGKLGYMAPEQLRSGSTITRQADLHAFATVLWEMLAGRRLFAGDSETEIVARMVEHKIPRLSGTIPGVPPEVDSVLQRGLAVALTIRYSTAREMCVALEKCGSQASSMQVGDWVQQQAKESLEARSKALGAIESDRDSSARQLPVTNEDIGSGGSGKDWLAHLSRPDLLLEAKAGATPVRLDSGPVAGTPDAVRTIPAPGTDSRIPGLRRAPRGLVVGGGVACVVLLVGAVWAVSSHSSGQPAAADAALATSAASASQRRAVEPPEELTVKARSPYEVASTSAESSSASATAPLPAGSPAPRLPVAQPPRPNCSPPYTIDDQGVRVPKRECLAPPSPPNPPKPNCNPPFTIDDQGVRVPKRECFR